METRHGIRVQLVLVYFSDSASLGKLLNNRSLINMMAWERLVLLNAADKKKIEVSDKDVITLLSSHPLFQRNGRFDKKTYEYIVRQSLALEPRQFEELLRENMKVRMIRQEVLKNLTVSDDEMRELFTAINGQVELSYITLDKNIFMNEAIIPESAALAEYTKNPEDFYEPEQILKNRTWFVHHAIAQSV